MTTNNYNPFHEKPIDAAFKVKAPVEDAVFKEKKTGKQHVKGFFSGIGKGAKAVGRGVKHNAQHTEAVVRRSIKISQEARRKTQEARVLHLRRKQEISEYKTNLLNLKHQKAIHKSNILSAKVATVEQKRALREAKRNRRGNPQLPLDSISPSIGPLSNGPRVIRRGPLSDRGFNKVNLNKPRKRGGFFS